MASCRAETFFDRQCVVNRTLLKPYKPCHNSTRKLKGASMSSCSAETRCLQAKIVYCVHSGVSSLRSLTHIALYSSRHYVHNTLSLPEDNGFQHCSWPCWHPLIFVCYCDRVCRVLVGFCSQCTVYQRTGFSTAAGTLYI